LHDLSFRLAQCIGLKAGEPCGFVARFDVVDSCFESEETLDVVHDLSRTPLEGLHNVFMHAESNSLSFDNFVHPNRLDQSHISLIHLQPSPSPEHYTDVPIDNPMICDANVDLGYKDNMFSMLGGSVNDCVRRLV